MRLFRAFTSSRKDQLVADANYYVGLLTPSATRSSPPPSSRRKAATPHTPPRPGCITLSHINSGGKREVLALASNNASSLVATGSTSNDMMAASSALLVPSSAWRSGGQPPDVSHVEEGMAMYPPVGQRLSRPSSLDASGSWSNRAWERKEL